ncbi:DNA polymerase family A-domain-containing protein [Glomus cerebriforme]|uniref:Mitochondrial DNA polymerase catalytic subunit n=1 Tax=Glomus cerebriforme TaxID=658196 RepID=A0A397SNW4_9GLOM|nr:DNA polymerase family A-domain-containing protein [Glomus cerebriforme]
MLSNTRQLKLSKPLYAYKPVNERVSLRYVVNYTQRTVKTNSNIQKEQNVDKIQSNTLSQSDQWLKHVTWSNFFTGVPRTDASNSKLSKTSKQGVPKKKDYLKTGIPQNHEVELKEGQSQKVINEAGVYMLPDWLYQQVFNRSARPVPPKNLVEISMEHLKKQGYYNNKADTVPDISPFELPKLCGKTISEHFWKIGEEQARPIRDLATCLVSTSLPTMPFQSNWILFPGWTRYEEGKPPKAVDYPNESILCFNTKTFDEYKYPLIACAASPTAWYSWISPRLISNDTDEINRDSKYLIPIGNFKENRLIVGHNVGTDRICIKEEYHYTESKIGFLDTKSLHIAVSGICSRLKKDWNKYNKACKNKNEQYLLQEKKFQKIYDVSSVNGLSEVYKFYCDQDLNKSERDIFVKGTFEELQDTRNLQQAIVSCANNVEAIHQVFQKLLPKFLNVCPHPVSFAGIIHMGSMFLTTNKSWEKFIIDSETSYKSLSESIESTLRNLADKTLKERNQNGADQWLKQLDWRIHNNNHPEWYNKIYNKKTNQVRVTALSQIAPILLKLKWLNYPVYHSKQYGWIYRVPIEDKHFTTNSELCEFPTQPEHIHYEPQFLKDKNGSYYRIPNKSGKKNRCGTPLSKKYIGDFENGTLQSDCKELEEILKFHAACTYWMSIRDRIKSQLLIYPGCSGIQNFGFDVNDEENIGIILPKAITMGTITRRIVENTWATATNPKEYLIGSEQRSMIKAPKGYKIVGADVDSQEMWISSLISDAEFGFHGATGLGLMMLQGSKSDGTDLHSRTAKILGISREDAKIFNYSRLYGAGIKTVLEMLGQSLTNVNLEESKERVENLFKKTKGQKYYGLGINGFWFGGSETYLANRLEEIVTSLEPITPVLRCGITNALKSANADQSYMTSRINWVVQSSGVDYLHLLLVSMKYLIYKYNINARFMLSVHDDIRYLVKEDDAYRVALALQISNLWTRAMFSHMLGIEDLPLTIAFFSGVDIDHVYRKEVDMKCTTVSHQIEIEPGTCVSIQDILRHQRTLRHDKSSLCDELLDTDIVKDLGSYDSILWKPYKSKDDVLFLKAQSMSSAEEIKKLHEESNQEKESSSESIFNRKLLRKTYDYAHTNQILNKKKRVFEPYVETLEDKKIENRGKYLQ